MSARGKKGGIYRTTNGGLNWHSFTDGITVAIDSVGVNGLVIVGNRIYLNVTARALPGFGGLFAREDIVTSVADAPHSRAIFHFALLDPYPNPFNPTITVEFMINKLQEIRLSIFDLLGREVNILAKGQFQTGRYRARWQGTGAQGAAVSTGIYFIRLQSDQASQIRRLLLIR